jgi:hypothetical protein
MFEFGNVDETLPSFDVDLSFDVDTSMHFDEMDMVFDDTEVAADEAIEAAGDVEVTEVDAGANFDFGETQTESVMTATEFADWVEFINYSIPELAEQIIFDYVDSLLT